MITEAMVMGAIGTAVFREGDAVLTVRLGPGGRGLVPCDRDFGFISDLGVERRFLPTPPRDLGELEEQLRTWSDRHHALDAAVRGMSPALSEQTRRDCLAYAETLLGNRDVFAFVRARLLGSPLDERANLGGALEIAGELGALRVLDLYRSLETAAGAIPEARTALDHVLFEDLEDERLEDFDYVRRAIIDKGLVADAAEALSAGDLNGLSGLSDGFRSRGGREASPLSARPLHRQARGRASGGTS